MGKKKKTIKLEIGKFYRVIDGSPSGHPGQIYQIDYGNDTFYAILTGSMTVEEIKVNGMRKGYFKLSVPTDDNVEISLVKKRPFIGTRKDFGNKEYTAMKFDENDFYILFLVRKNNPIYGKHYKKKLKSKK